MDRGIERPANLEECARHLADGVEAALPGWVIASVVRVMQAWAGAVPVEIVGAAAEAGARARVETGAAVRVLLLSDIDEQRTTPLALLRGATRYPTAVLREAGVPPVERDRFAEQAFPHDVYGLAPASFADLDPDLAEAGITWGAAKAFEHRRRHRTPPAGP